MMICDNRKSIVRIDFQPKQKLKRSIRVMK